MPNNAPQSGWDNPWISRGLGMVNPLLGIGYRIWRGIHNRHAGPPIYGTPGFGFNSGNFYGGFGGGYGLTGSGFGSSGAGSWGSGQGFGNGLGAIAGTNQFGLPTGPVDFSNIPVTSSPYGPPSGQPSPSNGLGQLGQPNAPAPHHDPTDDWTPSGNINDYLQQDDPYSLRERMRLARMQQ